MGYIHFRYLQCLLKYCPLLLHSICSFFPSISSGISVLLLLFSAYDTLLHFSVLEEVSEISHSI